MTLLYGSHCIDMTASPRTFQMRYRRYSHSSTGPMHMRDRNTTVVADAIARNGAGSSSATDVAAKLDTFSC